MAAQIDQVQVTEFSERVHLAAQQMESRLKKYCLIQKMNGDDAYYDGLGQVEAQEAQGRSPAIQFQDIDRNRRKITRNRYYIALPIDASDVRGMLSDPHSNLPTVVAAGINRKIDKVIYDASVGAVLTGRAGGTSVTASTDGVLTVDATAGLTYEKLLEAKQNFIDGDVMAQTAAFTITGDEHTALMGEVELISGDYTRDFVVEGGEIQRAMGVDLVKFGASATTPVIDVAGGVRSGIILAQGGVVLGISKEITIEIQSRPDLLETEQVLAVVELGATRTEGKLVQIVTTTD